MQPKAEEDNRMSLRFENGSQIKAVGTANDAARSESLSLLVIDECAFIDSAEGIWIGAQSTLATGGSAILLSTPNGVGNFFHKKWVDAVAGPIKKVNLIPDRDVENGRHFVTYQGVGENEFHPIFMH